MSDFSTRAIILRRIDHGDYDLIVTLMTKEYGKLSLIAKNAKKSIKRFSGVLELFSALDITGKKGR
ncbi:MAG: DNA repair protein RecO, partial [Deltaproteobacteria bacterium]